MGATAAFAAASLILSAAGTGVQIHRQNQMAEAQGEAAATQAEHEMMMLQKQAEEVTDQTNQKAIQRRLQALREQSQLMVSFGEAGVLGNSPLRQLATSDIQSGYDLANMEHNLNNRMEQNQMEQLAAYSGGVSGANKARSQATGPIGSSFQIGMSGAQGGMSGWATGKSIENA